MMILIHTFGGFAVTLGLFKAVPGGIGSGKPEEEEEEEEESMRVEAVELMSNSA